ncbi:hypothetical protein [Roseivirga sp.]|uniref:hypothetical protein n=1 Tax=Roseivirga sp. TaxID=1964215 RepID=UPI002B26BEFE|nr:hypothetical protein [Roseivirga sp.]
MTEQEANELLTSKILNKKLHSIKVYNHHQPYPFVEDNEAVVVSAAVAFLFEDEPITFYWHLEDSIFNFSLAKVEVDEDWDDIEITNIDTFKNMEGDEVSEVNINWTYFQKLDENFEILEEKLYVPQEMVLSFSNGSQLQIACVDFNIDPVSNDLVNLSYHMSGGLLISAVPYTEIAAPVFNDI